jgi:hypothetical protein
VSSLDDSVLVENGGQPRKCWLHARVQSTRLQGERHVRLPPVSPSRPIRDTGHHGAEQAAVRVVLRPCVRRGGEEQFADGRVHPPPEN